jgi:transcriptional regulator with PAS, ATPase and Fis domain
MVTINCAELPESLLEAELFGYEKGSFTGASQTGKAGLIEETDGGTLFLDEINSMPLAMQGKLLRAIEIKQIRRVGATKNKPVDFRLIAATNENLARLIQEKKFRSDLFYRLNVIPIKIPPLRERKEDIVPLALNFLKYYCLKYGKTKAFTVHTMKQMVEYDWPGNVRELKNCVERSIIMCVGDYIEITDIKTIAEGHVDYITADRSSKSAFHGSLGFNFEQLIENGTSLKKYLEECANAYVDYSLRHYGSSYKAARVLGTSQSSVIRVKNRASGKKRIVEKKNESDLTQ